MSVELRDRIVLDPKILVGKPTVRGTRISVEMILGLLADGWTYETILSEFPHLTREDILACLAFARDTIAEELYFQSAA
jgi:uncharacterized protein (DUF433 family)